MDGSENIQCGSLEVPVMFQVDLKKVGCGQKIQMRDVDILSNEIGFQLHSDSGCSVFGDTVVCSSIDRIGRMLKNIDQFCEIAISHAASDLLVSKIRPLFASVCIEYGPEFDTVEGMSLLSKSLSDGFKTFGIGLQNLHSVKSDYTFLTISIMGIRQTPQFEISNAGSVFLSRRLGASKMAVLRELDDEHSLPFTLEITQKRFLGGMKTDFVATDVTGFGLAGAMINLSERVGASTQIGLSNRHVVHEDVLSIPMSCFEADGLLTDAFETSCPKSRVMALCTEFAGPTIFFVETDSVDSFKAEFLNLHGWEPLHIGSFEPKNSRAKVAFSWNG